VEGAEKVEGGGVRQDGDLGVDVASAGEGGGEGRGGRRVVGRGVVATELARLWSTDLDAVYAIELEVREVGGWRGCTERGGEGGGGSIADRGGVLQYL
jgi:hypothetical protein